MKIIRPYHKIIFMQNTEDILKTIELAGRTCYKSEDRITQDSSKKFVAKLISSGHHSVIEHTTISVKFVCDRGVSHELVRHRLASYSQESTRYANYSQERFGREITVIKPYYWSENSKEFHEWRLAMEHTEKSYLRLLKLGARPEEARSVLPNSLKTEIVMTCNVREWRHVLNLRCSKAAHPQMRELMIPLLEELHKKVQPLFSDIFNNISSTDIT